jgi:SAM-dependent methyltransferase
LVKEFRQHRCEQILDLGCGSGRHVVHLAKAGFRVCGLDNSPTGLSLARQWLQEEGLSASLVLADMRLALPIRDESFEGLLSTQVIHHALHATVLQTIAEIWRVLNWGGIAFVTVPAHHNPEGKFEEIEPNTFVPLQGGEAGLPHHIFSAEELEAAFDRFRILDLSLRGSKVIAILAQKARI